MTRSQKSAVKILLLAWLIFTPYYIWLFVSLLRSVLPPWPWPAVVFLSYLAVGIPLVMTLAKRIKN
jgi:hypothetical protein